MAEAAEGDQSPRHLFVRAGPVPQYGGRHPSRGRILAMIAFVGQVGREMREREAFQELDYRAVFGTVAKWAAER
jgi:acetolactate synthase-1/2/3 large subunit